MIRTYGINIRKNWTVSNKDWNNFFNRLKNDMEDILNDMKAIEYDYSDLFSASEDISKNINSHEQGAKL